MRALLLILLSILACSSPPRSAVPPSVTPPDAGVVAMAVPEGAAPGCTVDGKSYDEGEEIPRGDQCNSCVCRNGHQSKCTVMICNIEIVDRVYFAADSAQIQSSSTSLLDTVAEVLAAHPELALVLLGHAAVDEASPGPLSLQRAKAVHAELVARGVGLAQLARTDGLGTRQPLGRDLADDRRVDFQAIEAPLPAEERSVDFEVVQPGP